MKRIKQLIDNSAKSGSLLNSIIVLLSGSMVAQLCTIITAPIMTRVFSEEDIGEYTLIITAIALFGNIVCGKYDYSIVSEEKESNIFPLLKFALYVTAATSIVLGCGYAGYIYYFGETTRSLWLLVCLIVLFLFLTGVRNIVTSVNNRNKDYKVMTQATISSTIAKDVSMVGLGFFNTGLLGLLISQVLYSIIGLHRQAKKILPSYHQIIGSSRNSLLDVARKHKKQPLYSVPANFANNFSYSALNVFISSLFGNIALAHYSLSFRLLGLPLNLVSVNASKAFFQRASKEYSEKGDYKSTFLKMSLFLACISVPMAILLVLFAPPAIKWFFGDSWEVAGVYVQIMAPLFAVRLIVGALSPSMTISNCQQYELIVQLLFGVSTLVAYIFAPIWGCIENFLFFIMISNSVIYVFYYTIMLFHTCKTNANL